MTLACTILGPVSVRIAGQPVRVPTGRPQTLLAALLMGQGRRVSTERLVASLWEDPPASAMSNLRTYAARLRVLLGPYGDRLARSGDGYLVSVADEELDLFRWAHGLTQAQCAAERSAYGEAADHLSEALGLWTGAAADGVPRIGPVGRSLNALDTARCAAIERYAHCCVNAGRYESAVDCLRPLLAEHPAREGAWHQLALALAGSGDRAGALETYAAARRALVAEVGVEPGTQLRELQRSLLRGPEQSGPAARPASGPTAGPRPPAPEAPPVSGRHAVPSGRAAGRLPASQRTPPAQPGPRTLPPDSDLVGRDTLLATIMDELADPAAGAVVALHGPAGVGKSVLAVHAARRLAARYPDGQVYLDLCGSSPGLAPMTLVESLGYLRRALGIRAVAGSITEELVQLRAALAGRRVLFILDNIVDAAQVRRLLTGLAGAAALLTSRTVLTALEVRRHVAVGELTPDASLSLLARYAGADRAAETPEDAHRLAVLCGHLPLALRIAGARLASRPDWSLAAMVGRLADERHRLDELAFDDLAVRAGLALTCKTLAERPGGTEALALFDAWGTVCVPVPGLDLARVLTGGAGQPARSALDRLAEARLVEPIGDDRYLMHDLVRIYAMERARDGVPAAERDRILHRARCYYLATARRARDLLRVNPDRPADQFAEAAPTTVLDDQQAALSWLEAERVNLLAAARHAAGEGTADGDLFATRLAGELYPFLPMRGYYRDWQALSEIALACARRLGSHDDEATALTHLAGARGRLGSHRAAVAGLRTALALRERSPDGRAVASALDHLGMALANAGELAEAKECFRRGIVLHRVHRNVRGLGVTLNNLADAHLKSGETADALKYLRQSLHVRRHLGDQLGIGITTLTIGQVHAQAGNREQALDWLDDALRVARETGNREAEWRALTVRADLHGAAGRPDRARQDLTTALALSEAIGDTAGAAQVRQVLDDLAATAGETR